MNIMIKQEPIDKEEEATPSTYKSEHVPYLAKLVKQEPETNVTTRDAATNTAYSHVAHNKVLENPYEEMETADYDKSKTVPGKLPIPRLKLGIKLNNRKRQRRTLRYSVKPLPHTQKGLVTLLHKMDGADKWDKGAAERNAEQTSVVPQIPVGMATIFCSKQQQQKSHSQTTEVSRSIECRTSHQLQTRVLKFLPTDVVQNSAETKPTLTSSASKEELDQKQQLHVSNQIQNLAQKNPILAMNLSNKQTDQKQQVKLPIYVSANPIPYLSQQNLNWQNLTRQNLTQQNSNQQNSNEQNLNQQNSLLLMNSNQPGQIITPLVMSGNQQQHLLQQKNIIFQNGNQPNQMSPFQSSNSIFAHAARLAFQPMLLPTVLPQSIDNNISGFLIPTGRSTNVMPSSTLLTAPSQPQMIQSIGLMPSVPLVNAVPVFQTLPTMVHKSQNVVVIGNQNNSTDNAILQKPVVSGSVITCNTVCSVSAGLESNLNTTGVSVSSSSVTSENQTQVICSVQDSQSVKMTDTSQKNSTSNQLNTSHQSDNQSCTLIKDEAARSQVDGNKADALNVPRVMFLQSVNQSSHQMPNIAVGVPCIETLPSGLQVIKNFNPVDMTSSSGLCFPLFPADKLNTAGITMCNKQGQLIYVEKVQTSPKHMVPPSSNTMTEQHSLLLDSEKEIHKGMVSNTCVKGQLQQNTYCDKMLPSYSALTMCELEKPPEYKRKENTATNGEVNSKTANQSQLVKHLETNKDVTFTNQPEPLIQNVMIKQEKMEDASETSVTMPTLTMVKQRETDETLVFDIHRAMPKLTKVDDRCLQLDKEHDKYEMVSGTLPTNPQHATHLEQIKALTMSLPPLSTWDQTSWFKDGEPPTQTLSDHDNQSQKSAWKKNKHKIKMFKRQTGYRVIGMKGIYSGRPILPKRPTTNTAEREVSRCVDSNANIKKCHSLGLWEYVHHISGSGSATTDVTPDMKIDQTDLNASKEMIANTDTPVGHKPLTEGCDSFEIKIDSVFSLNVESKACFLASKCPYHRPELYHFPHSQAFDACFVVLEKESPSRFLALQTKVSRLRPKRACSRQCRSLALHTMCQNCSFSPISLHR